METTPSDYNYTMPEHTRSDMYYTYMEVIIPTDKIQTYNASEYFSIGFGREGRTTINFRGSDSSIDHISVIVRPESLSIFPDITNIDEINSLFSNEYIVVSLMVLPKLNINPLITPDMTV